MPEHKYGLMWLFFQDICSISQKTFYDRKAPSENFRSQMFDKERTPEFCIFARKEALSTMPSMAYACFWVWASPNIDTKHYFASSIFVGDVFSPS